MVGKMSSVLCIVEMLTARSVRSIFHFSLNVLRNNMSKTR